MLTFLLKTTIGACLAATLATSAGADSALAPHQAVYGMALAPGSQTLDVASADGVMVYRASRECGGWTVENHTVIRYLQEGGQPFEDKWDFASWEADDGLSYRFRAVHDDGASVKRIEGVANLDSIGGGGLAVYTAPQEFELELPEGTLFPTAHLGRLIAAQQDGKTIFTRVVFDGTTETNPYLVSAIIAPLPKTGVPLAEALGAPASGAFWTRSAYFPYHDDGEIPDFEMTIELRLDGIAERVEQDFDGLGLRGKLLGLQLLPDPEC